MGQLSTFYSPLHCQHSSHLLRPSSRVVAIFKHSHDKVESGHFIVERTRGRDGRPKIATLAEPSSRQSGIGKLKACIIVQHQTREWVEIGLSSLWQHTKSLVHDIQSSSVKPGAGFKEKPILRNSLDVSTDLLVGLRVLYSLPGECSGV